MLEELENCLDELTSHRAVIRGQKGLQSLHFFNSVLLDVVEEAWVYAGNEALLDQILDLLDRLRIDAYFLANVIMFNEVEGL